MRFADRLPVVLLLVVGLALAAGNLWVTAARSTIPLDLGGRIVSKEILHEKHPGFDDVFFLVLENGRWLHVDELVFRGLAEGDVVEKYSRDGHTIQILHADGLRSVLPLAFSRDFRGMRIVMPIALGVAAALAGVARGQGRRLNHGGTESTEKFG